MVAEKLTDAQLALAICRDAVRGDVDQIVAFSNDSDVEPPLIHVRRDDPDDRIGLVMLLRAAHKRAGRGFQQATDGLGASGVAPLTGPGAC